MSKPRTTTRVRKIGQPPTTPRAEKLAHYADSPLQRFLQIDGWRGCYPDDIMGCDADGDQVMFGITEELMRSPGEHLPIRVLIHEDARPEDVRRLLVKLTDNLDEAFGFLREETERDLFSRADVPADPPF